MEGEPQALKWYLPATLAAILGQTLVAAIALPAAGIDLGFDEGTSALIVGILLFVSVTELLVLRLAILPPMVADANVKRESPYTLACSFALAPAVYGVVVVVITGEGLLALPFGAIAVVSLLALWGYLQEAYSRPRIP